MSFDGKVVLITGGSSGIGAGAARHLAKLGAKVSIIGRSEKRLSEVAEQIKQSGALAPLAIVADVTKDAKRIVDETIKYFGQLDVLINNAGIVITDTATKVQMPEFDRIFDINVRSVIILTKLCVPHLEQTKGNIVNVSSIGGLKPIRTVMSNCMTKAALDQFTKCSALDLASKGIRVNSINPSVIRTPIFETLGIPSQHVEKMLEDYKNKYPVGRIGNVSDTNAAIAFLADDKSASFLTGILLPVDGGCLIAGV